MKDKALTNFILAAALSTTLFQLSGGFWVAQVIAISILGISVPILVIGQNIKNNILVNVGAKSGSFLISKIAY